MTQSNSGTTIDQPPDIDLAMSLIEELPGPNAPHDEQRETENIVQDLAGTLSLGARGVVIEAITDQARTRHPSMYVPRAEATEAIGEVASKGSSEKIDETIKVPEGFVSWRFIKKGSELKSSQFVGIRSFSKDEDVRIADTYEGVTEFGRKVRICDLRPHMSSKVRNGGPKKKSMEELLDRDVVRDVLNVALSGHGGKSVSCMSKVRYSSRGGTKNRAYWMVVTDEKADGAITIARLADCDSLSSEEDLYRRVFGRRM